MIFARSELKWHEKGLMSQIGLKAERKTKIAAKRVLMDAKNNIKSLGLVETGELLASLQMYESKYQEICWLVGVFTSTKGRWVDSVGARAIFLEYGHAFPYQGRDWVRKRVNIKKQVMERPFLRPALDGNADRIRSSFHNIL